MNQPGSRSMFGLAEKASDGAIAVNLAMEVLIDIAPTLKIAIARVTVEVFLDLVAAKALFIIKTRVAVVTLVIWLIRLGGFSPMAQVSHVLVNSMLTTKVPIARITLKVWRIVASRVHVLLP